MGQIHKINDEYYIEFTARGLQYQQKAGRELAQAERLLKEVEDKIARGELLTIVREVLIDVFAQDFLKFIEGDNTSITFQRFTGFLNHFQNFLKHHKPDVKKLSQITPTIVEQYKQFLIKGRQDETGYFNPLIINFNLLLLREFLEYGIKTGYINDNPTIHVRLIKPNRLSQALFVTDAERTLLMEQAREDVKGILQMSALTGMRYSEIVALTDHHIRRDRMVIEIPGVHRRETPLSAEVLELIRDRREFTKLFCQKDGLAYTPDEIEEVVRQLFDKAGLKHKNIHALRHTFAANLLKKGVSWFRLYKILGHSDSAVMMAYSAFIPLSREDMYSGLIQA